jgi:hypothetical protein
MLLQVYNVGLVGSNFSSDCLSKILHILHLDSTITINVPVVYMGRYEVVLRGDYP